MKISTLIKYLTQAIEMFGDKDVHIEAELDGRRTAQVLAEVLIGHDKVLLVSKEAMIGGSLDLDDLPVYPTPPELQEKH